MPIIKSAKKRVKTAQKASARNVRTKRNLKVAIKAFQGAIKGGKKAADEELKRAQSAVDTAVKKGVLHKNKGARKKSQLARAAKIAAGVTVAAGAAGAARAATKKSTPEKTKKTAKKTAAKAKTAAKKAPAKKPAAKSTAKKSTTKK